MKLFISFIFCLLTPFVVNASPSQGYNCVCVDILFCNDEFSKYIKPRSLRQECNVGNQVCCRPEHITQYPNENLNSPSGADINTAQCGIRYPITSGYGRIVDPSYLANLGEVPWQVAVLRNSSVGNFLIGSGVLLNEYAILTAAHILNSLYPDQVIVRLGENNFQADPSRKYPALNGRISRITINDQFNRNTLQSDFAVLCLRSAAPLSQTINPVCLPDPGDFISDSASNCVVSGWGKNSFYGNYSSTLRKSYQNLVPNDICNSAIQNRVQDPTFKLRQTFVCANGNDGRDATCTGDAGAPLTCTNKNGQQVLVGISKSGISCGENRVPGIFSNVRYPRIYEWLKTTAQACVPQQPPSPPSYNNYNNNNYQSSYNNNDYTVVNYNSNQNYNGQSDYNEMNNNYNSNPSDYLPNSGYPGRSSKTNSPSETA